MDRASAATNSADRQRWGTASRRQDSTVQILTVLFVVTCKLSLGSRAAEESEYHVDEEILSKVVERT